MLLSNPLVLCVDDEVIGLEVRRRLLQHAGYRVLTAQDGPTALDIFRDQPIDAVVLDYSMPGMTGGEVAAHMRREKPAMPILLLTAHLTLPAAILANVDFHMIKGEGASALIDRLGEMLRPQLTCALP